MIFRESEPLPLVRVAKLASLRAVHAAFAWFHLHEPRIQAWQREAVAIPAPPFAEGPRSEWFADRMRDLGLANVHIDEEGNALGLLRPDDGSPLVLLSAHLDTVFSASTDVLVREEEGILYAPGISDNGAGLAGLLAIAAAMKASGINATSNTDTTANINVLFAANVGEEAEGDLRGMRYLFGPSTFAGRICSAIALEGADTGTVVSRALGSRRFRVEITGPGGHAWTDAGQGNPIVVLASAIATLTAQPLPQRPRTTLNIGEIIGGTSITSIPQSATATFDIRSSDPNNILSVEVRLYRAVEDAILAARQTSTSQSSAGDLRATIACIGDRPAAELPSTSRLLSTVRAVDRHLLLKTEERLGSTDANIPLALGREAAAIGAGGTAGGIHTTNEWFDPRGRDLALRRVLLILLDLCGGAPETRP